MKPFELNTNLAVKDRRITDLEGAGTEDWKGIGDIGPVPGEAESYSFRCRLSSRAPVGEETDQVRTVVVAGGSLQVVGISKETVPETTLDAVEDGSVYCVWTYATDDNEGEWSDPFWAFGTPAVDDSTQLVIKLATITDGVLVQDHCGDVVVSPIPPPSGDKYMVLRLNDNGGATWDWVRAH
jgi:hypothetical protein